MLEKQQGRPLDEISGFNGMKNQLTNIRKDTLGKIDEQHNGIMTKLNATQDNMVTNIEKDRPKIELYEELPDPLKKVVRDTAETQFAKQIGDNKEQIVKTIAGQFGPDMLKQALGGINPENQLNGILNGAGGQFANSLGLGNLGGLAGGLGGGLGGAGGALGKFF